MAGVSFKPFYELWRDIPEIVTPIARQLYHWAYYSAFLVSLDRIKEGSRSTSGLSNEVSRAPELLSYFEKALAVTMHKHIDLQSDQLFDLKLLGGIEEFFRWRDAGYRGKVPRNKSTYDKRLAAWIEIFDNGAPITYEEVVGKRMSGGTDGEHVPYWMIWNYGSLKPTGRPGYPNHAGIHFIEAGESSLIKFKKRALGYLQTYLIALLKTGRARRPQVLGDAKWRKVYDATY